MASGNSTVTIAQKYGLPQFTEDGDFDSWVRDMELWGLVTDLDAKKRGPVVFLSLSLKARQAFIECESSKKIKTALRHQTRNCTSSLELSK